MEAKTSSERDAKQLPIKVKSKQQQVSSAGSDNSMLTIQNNELRAENDSVMLVRRSLIKFFGMIPCLCFLHVFIRASVVVFELNSVLLISEKVRSIIPLVRV